MVMSSFSVELVRAAIPLYSRRTSLAEIDILASSSRTSNPRSASVKNSFDLLAVEPRERETGLEPATTYLEGLRS